MYSIQLWINNWLFELLKEASHNRKIYVFYKKMFKVAIKSKDIMV